MESMDARDIKNCTVGSLVSKDVTWVTQGDAEDAPERSYSLCSQDDRDAVIARDVRFMVISSQKSIHEILKILGSA